MYQNVTQEFKNIISGDNRTFRAHMVCGSEELSGFRSLKLTAQANEDTDTISIGGAVSSYIEVNMVRPVQMVTGKEYRLEIGLDVSGKTEWVPMGLFTPQAPKGDDETITFTAYDRMVSKFSGAYFSSLTSYPADGKAILQEISTKTGVPLGNLSSLPSGVMVPERTQTGDSGTTTAKPFDGYTYREAVKYLAQMYGCFATINRTGALELRWYATSGYTAGKNRIYNDPESAEQIYTLQKLTCNAGGTTLTAGSGTTGITIENPVMTQAILNSVYSKLKGMQYLPSTCSFFGDVRLDLGDIITVTKKDGALVKIPIMGLSLEYDGGVKIEVGSYGNTEQQESLPKGPTATAIDRVYTDLFLVKEVIANKVSVDVLKANYATIIQLNAVEARIDKITATEITVDYLEANYAKLDMANVDTAVIRQGFLENLMVSQGLIADRVISPEVTVTDCLTGVNIVANDIKAGKLDAGEIEVVNLNAANITVGTINGQQIAPGAVDLSKLDKVTAGKITQTEADVEAALKEAGLAITKAADVQNEVRYANEFVKGTQTVATASWTGKCNLTKLTDGQQVTFWLPYNSAANATLNLTLTSGAVTGAVPIYYSGVTRLGTQYTAGNSVRLIYRENVTIGTTKIAKGWWCDANYDTNNVDRLRYQTVIKAKTAITSGSMIVSDSAGYVKMTAGAVFDVRKAILWAGSALAAGATGNNNYLMFSAVNVTSTKSGWTSTAYKTVYLSGTLNGNDFTISSEVFTTTEPASENGLTYIVLGQLYSSTNMVLFSEHPMYRYENGAFRNIAENALSIADGKNTTYYQSIQPSGADYKENDIWFDTDDGYKMYYWKGSAWAAAEYGSSALASSSVIAGKLAAGAVTAGKIAANAIVAGNIQANAVTAGKIAANAVTASTIAASAVTVDKLAANAVTAGKIAARTITADKIVAGAITANEIAASTITGAKIAATTITAANIATGAITAVKIAAGAVTADKIKVATLEAIIAKIGGFTINSVALYSGMTTISDTTHDGVYIGTAGIACGKGSFKVTNTGNVTCKNIYSAGNVSFYATDTTNGGVYSNANLSVAKNANVGGKLDVVGAATIRANCIVKGVMSATSTISSDAGVNANGTQGMYCGGPIYAKGVLHAEGGIYWGNSNCTYSNGTIHSFVRASDYLHVNTSAGAYGINWWASDSRLKKDILPTSVKGIDFVKQLSHKQYGWKDSNNRENVKIGYLAHELRELDENIVHAVKQEDGAEYDEILQIDETRLIPYLSKALQELIEIAENQKKELEELKQSLRA